MVGQENVGKAEEKGTFSGIPCALQSFVLGRVFLKMDIG